MPVIGGAVGVLLPCDVALDGFRFLNAGHGQKLSYLTDPCTGKRFDSLAARHVRHLAEIVILHRQPADNCCFAFALLLADQHRHIIKFASGVVGAVDSASEDQTGNLPDVRRIVRFHHLSQEMSDALCSVPLQGVDQIRQRVYLVLIKKQPESIHKVFLVCKPIRCLEVPAESSIVGIRPREPAHIVIIQNFRTT